MKANPTHYEILNLPFPHQGLSKQALKLAYHKALLKHHPDKSPSTAVPNPDDLPSTPPPAAGSTSTKKNGNLDAYTYTIDQITTAYKTLSSPFHRAEYDRTLLLSRSKQKHENGETPHTGLEIVDLEDLTYTYDEDDDRDCWYRGCRCGDEKGFLVTEDELEREVETGEVVVGCRGCSLWIKVVFAVDDDDDQGSAKG